MDLVFANFSTDRARWPRVREKFAAAGLEITDKLDERTRADAKFVLNKTRFIDAAWLSQFRSLAAVVVLGREDWMIDAPVPTLMLDVDRGYEVAEHAIAILLTGLKRLHRLKSWCYRFAPRSVYGWFLARRASESRGALEKELLQDYMIVTRYAPGTGMLPKHRDYEGPSPRPLIQFWVLLSEPQKDYRDGNLVLYARDGKRYRVESELGVRKGDALIFDKSLEHEVEITGPAPEGARGRWTLLIGARARRDAYHKVVLKRIAFHPWMFPATRTVLDLMRRPSQQNAAA